jgi:sterol desaturase/sphingolipid hydroxylase (fatty acid hydroxylase superfamily)
MEALIVPLAMFVGLVVVEWLWPARALPEAGRWRLKGLLFMGLYFVVASTAPLLWTTWLGEHRLMDASGLGTWGGAAFAFVVVELGIYAWHRTMHRVDFLWRWFHQMHHSAERVDVFGAFYFHPLDMLGFTFVGSLALVWATGVTAEAAGIANLLATFLAMLQHANIKTPHWLGYLINRPEQHALHHERGVHAYNYADFVFIDLLFGTHQNPRTWDAQAGLYDGASQRVFDMLIGRDLLAAQQTQQQQVEPARISLTEA